MDTPIFFAADLYEQVINFIARNTEAQTALGIASTSPGRDEVIAGLGGNLDIWSEDHRPAIMPGVTCA